MSDNDKHIRAVQRFHEGVLLKKANVNVVYCGHKHTGGKNTRRPCIVVGVAKKVPVNMLASRDIIPSGLEDVETDVVESGHIEAQFDWTKQHRPIVPGISIGHKNITAGTLGCFVTAAGDEVQALSNNHVFANSNDALLGDAIFQPGPYDGGNSTHTAAILTRFVPIVFENGGEEPPPPSPCPWGKGAAAVLNAPAGLLGRETRLLAVLPTQETGGNLVDAAIAKPTVDFHPDIPEIGRPLGAIEAELGMPVQKSGRTTGHTTGEITGLNATVLVDYGNNRRAKFTDQLLSGPMSEGGDSGSALLNDTKYVVGLLFAGSGQLTVYNRIQNVLAALEVEIL